MEGFITKFQNIIIGVAKEITNKLDSILTTNVNQLKFTSFNKSFRASGKGTIKNVTLIANNGQSATVNITVDHKYKTTFSVGAGAFRQNTLGYSTVATLNEPILFNTYFEIETEANNLEGYVIYKIED